MRVIQSPYPVEVAPWVSTGDALRDLGSCRIQAHHLSPPIPPTMRYGTLLPPTAKNNVTTNNGTATKV